MPRTRLLTTDDWPEAELRAAVLAGELVAVGACWASPTEPQTPSLRAAAAAWSLGDARFIAGTRTAAWIWGAVSRAPSPVEGCVPLRVRVHTDGAVHVREVVIADEDTVVLGGLRVTTPLRTVVDLLRSPGDRPGGFDPADARAVAGLLAIEAVSVDEVIGHLAALGTIPMVRQAERRLAAVQRLGGCSDPVSPR
ncbi:type IV toxin-antitoxin system AbiEi family antitoxin [Curtobacterium sp. AB451]|uniref:type IV toxin-antitoxin system AbiEi family antitoxin n=1 Tax=Curtobacterium sp. AB451 TaxID=3422306 RepID=UPI003D3322B0